MVVQYDDLRRVPFRFGGRYPDAMDCFGLLLELYRRNGIRLPDPFATITDGSYGHEGNGEVCDVVERVFNFTTLWRRVETAREGTVLVISRFGKTADHVGIALDECHYVYAAEKVGVVVARIRRSAWTDGEKLKGMYDYVGA